MYTGVHAHTHTINTYIWLLGSSAGKESAYIVGDLGSISGLGKSPGERNGYPLQYSGLENSMDCIVHGVAKSRTQLSNFYYIYIREFSHSVVSNSLWPRGLQHARLPCPSQTPGACSNLGPSSRWCYQTISSSVFTFSSCLQSFPASESFPMSQFFASGSQSIKSFSFSLSPSNEYSGLISFRMDWLDLLQSKRLSRVFSNTTVQNQLTKSNR